jgi:enoyl-CoA hydratase/carnithine racemase
MDHSREIRIMSAVVELRVNGPVALLTLRVPPINALDESALQALTAAVNRAEEDEVVRAIVIASGIRGIFCAGGDLKYWPRVYPGDAGTVGEAGRKVFGGIEQVTKPTIAAIQGKVIGDGLSLALACDIRLASPESTFRLPELEYGFIPGWGTIGRLVDAAGKAFASELLLLGEEASAARAHAVGLVTRVVEGEDLLPYAEALAERIAAKPPMAVRSAKAALRGGCADGTRQRSEWELSCFKDVWGNREWRDGIAGLSGAKSRKG